MQWHAVSHSAVLVATCNVQRYNVTRTAISIVSGFAYNYRGCFMIRHDIVHAGLMLGPMLLGWIADVTSVRVALHMNAVLLILTMMYFGAVAAETKCK